MGKMGKKSKGGGGGGGGKKKQAKEVKDGLPEVDKEFYEIQINDLNAKLTRLTNFSEKIEEENTQLKVEIETLDRDRADVIAYLKRKLGEKCEEITELTERNHALNQEKQAEKNQCQATIKKKDEEFKEMNDHLTAEIKLLNGKLNSLEEFKIHRKELLEKFIKQQNEMEEQEKNHKKTLYEVQKKFLISKDKLRQEMEEKLLQLSLDFQKATESRIASTTQSVIKENIAINNELSLLIASWQSLFDENEALKEKLRQVNVELEIEVTQKNKTMSRNVVQSQVIDRLAFEHKKLKQYYTEVDQLRRIIDALEKKVEQLELDKRKAEESSSRVGQQWHDLITQAKQQESNFNAVSNRNHKNEITIKKALLYVKEALDLKERRRKRAITLEDEYKLKEQLLMKLDDLFTDDQFMQSFSPELKEESVATVFYPDFGQKYYEGKLGIISKTDGSSGGKEDESLSDDSEAFESKITTGE